MIKRSKYFNLTYPTFRYVHQYLINKKVLDLGCSSGIFLNYLSNGSVGVDIDINNLIECRKRGLIVVQSDLNFAFPFINNSVEAVLCSHILEHVRAPIDFLKELRRILNKRAVVIIGLPIEGGIAGPRFKYFRGHPGHLYSFSPQNLIRLLELNNIKAKKIFFHLAKVGYKRNLFWLNDIFQFLPSSILYKLSSSYYCVAEKLD
ncbi:MAG: class I SAM-dependent methyltransferase [Candidatus Lokiarchaeia archaeon]